MRTSKKSRHILVLLAVLVTAAADVFILSPVLDLPALAHIPEAWLAVGLLASAVIGAALWVVLVAVLRPRHAVVTTVLLVANFGALAWLDQRWIAHTFTIHTLTASLAVMLWVGVIVLALPVSFVRLVRDEMRR